MDSELELHEAVQELHAVATVPDLYPVLVHNGAVKSLLNLLSHENTDIAVAVVDLLQVRCALLEQNLIYQIISKLFFTHRNLLTWIS